MILIYAIRLASSKSTFPISVSPSGLATEEDRKYWIRVQWFLFIYFGAYIAIEAIVFVPFSLLELALFSRFHSSVVFSASKGVARILDAAIFLGISLYILGRQGKDTAVKLLRLPEPRHAMIGVFIPTFISALVPAGEWAVARIHWAQHNIGLTQPPEFASYLDLVNAWQPWLLLMVLGAFAEEVVFRGVLLSFFIKRYGLHRGIFFTGIAWAMIHFRADRYSGLNFAEVLLQLVFRIAFCVALNFVLAWMTLRWKSIIPAGLAHTVWNIIVTSGIVVGFEWRWGVDIFSWAVVAVVLWRYWPIENPTESTSIPTDAPEVPA
jgi:membrane protease YdiL (CAAX protease family)